ncbi:MAG: radical SAM protein [Candidatus Omnitrophota bacterium]|nr:MAG: radical SAM protein [Candidatus Omnitrophota bacterium]
MDAKQFSSDKILKHLDRVNEWLFKANTFPVTLELDITNICNNRCPKCFGFYGDNSSSIPSDKAKSILCQIKELGGKAVTFTGGGEPLCHPDAAKLIAYAKNLGLDTALITNGFSLDKNTIDTVLKSCTWIRISLDAATPKLYRQTHGMGKVTFDKTLNNIKLLVERKKTLKNETVIGIGFLTADFTLKEMYACTKLCKNMEVDYIQFRPYLRLFAEETEPERKVAEVLRKIKRCFQLAGSGFDVLYSKHKYDSMKFDQFQRKYKVCYGHHFTTTIAADQKLYLCCHMRGVEKYCLGDLKKKSFKEIWNSKRRVKVYENIDFKDCPALCRCNTFNEILWNIKQEISHKNFL